MSEEGDFIDLTLTAETNFIPVNANKTSGSPWKKDAAGTALVGFPVVRDFNLAPMRDLSGWNGVGNPPPGPAIDDPELKSLTAKFSPAFLGNVFQVDIFYSGEGRIRLWTDRSKTTEILGALPTFPECTFYAEGIEPSSGENDITVQVSVETPTATVVVNQYLTVTPIVAEFSVTPKPGGLVTLLKNTDGQVVGLNAGTQSADGGMPGGDDGDPNKVAVIFRADLNPRTNVPGNPQFLQLMMNVTNGAPAGVSFTVDGQLNMQLQYPETFPILDSVAGFEPFYPTFVRDPNTADRVKMMSWDTPFIAEKADFGSSAWADTITRVDITEDFRMYLVWQYPDNAIYTLGYANWRVVFKADTPPGGALTVDAGSLVTANAAVRSHADPLRVTGGSFNTSFEWMAV